MAGQAAIDCIYMALVLHIKDNFLKFDSMA